MSAVVHNLLVAEAGSWNKGDRKHRSHNASEYLRTPVKCNDVSVPAECDNSQRDQIDACVRSVAANTTHHNCWLS